MSVVVNFIIFNRELEWSVCTAGFCSVSYGVMFTWGDGLSFSAKEFGTV